MSSVDLVLRFIIVHIIDLVHNFHKFGARQAKIVIIRRMYLSYETSFLDIDHIYSDTKTIFPLGHLLNHIIFPGHIFS